ncbi:MAG TPA: hypothetical protein VFV31_06640, partial [Chitinophagaceae bacterium]|nr:hypothetical protein [Chitinophagaceae bacterium]
LWLTISTPFVFNAQRQLITEERQSAGNGSQQDDESANPLASTTEEKTPNNSNSLSEFLNEGETIKQPVRNLIRQYNPISISLYVSFQGELLVPPPNI